jgi:hypothetical protein
LRSAFSAHIGEAQPPRVEPEAPSREFRDEEQAGVTEEEMRKRLEVLRIEHRDLDAAIAALSAAGTPDQLQIARLKKRKLRLKDQIMMIEDYLIPDIIA